MSKLQEIDDIIAVLVQKRQEFTRTFGNVKVTPLTASVVHLECSGISLTLDISTLNEVTQYLNECVGEPDEQT